MSFHQFDRFINRIIVLVFGSDVFPYGIYMLTYEHITNLFGNFTFVQKRRADREKRGQPSTGFEMALTIFAGAIAGT